MNLGDCLEELRDNILSDRSDQISGVRSDQLWTDKTLVRYINEAQKKFAKGAECIRDATTPETCQVPMVALQKHYPLHPKVIGVLSGKFHHNHPEAIDLGRAGHAQLDTYHSPDRFLYDVSYITGLQPGKPLAFTTDEAMLGDARGSWNAPLMRIYPNISPEYAVRSDGTPSWIWLRVVRFPMKDLKLSQLNDEPEIAEQYHMDMLEWAGYLALRKPDLDVAGGDAPGRATELRKSFEGHIEDAKRELKRRMFTPASFKFGGNGFTYERDWDT
jgi:hypothetical protein